MISLPTRRLAVFWSSPPGASLWCQQAGRRAKRAETPSRRQRDGATHHLERCAARDRRGARRAPPDAITRFGLQNILRLARNGASTFDARTVSPSVTAAAMGSLLTGAAPSHHGLESERFHIPRAKGALHPVAHELARCGMPSSGFMAHVPWLIRPLARRIARTLGLTTVRFRGNNATQVLEAARTQLRIQDTGLILLHWADADRAGHEHGWMSDAYGQAAVAMDRALGQLMRVVDLSDRSTVMIALADHGGGVGRFGTTIAITRRTEPSRSFLRAAACARERCQPAYHCLMFPRPFWPCSASHGPRATPANRWCRAG